jgi:hypothetical protein
MKRICKVHRIGRRNCVVCRQVGFRSPLGPLLVGLICAGVFWGGWNLAGEGPGGPVPEPAPNSQPFRTKAKVAQNPAFPRLGKTRVRETVVRPQQNIFKRLRRIERKVTKVIPFPAECLAALESVADGLVALDSLYPEAVRLIDHPFDRQVASEVRATLVDISAVSNGVIEDLRGSLPDCRG